MFFFFWGAPQFTPILIVSIIADFYLSKNMRQDGVGKKSYLLISLILNIGLLAYFKYANFFITNLGFTWETIVLPLGISFFTFQKISYIVDVYQGKNPPFKKIQDFALYILFFPQLIAGPIVRYGEIKTQIENIKDRFRADQITQGFYRFSVGLTKKVFIADQIAEVADRVFRIDPEMLTMGQAWLGAIAYAFQIYFDFSGYTDMALGIGLMMGFRLPENFNYPYISRNFTEFWRRWHMTLSAWMKDYLYIPLGGNQVNSKLRLYLNLWIVFLLSGFWHGAEWNFIVWGLYNGLFLVIDRISNRKIGWLPTFLFVLIGWVIFRADSMGAAFIHIYKMFDFESISTLIQMPRFLYERQLSVLLFAAMLSFLPSSKKVRILVSKAELTLKKFSVVQTLLAILFFAFSLSIVLSSDLQSFIYFRF
ncbi:MBOAT family O-acyltransferase [Portibacter lacus]|uniref:MBOAT family O-acyltransferase n=1 Tax=Portibacter lacus TaxID=1099794 RepID=UPI001F25786D|nr:MBOAT family O-acyltransferase [Portibacter lacus]